MELVYLWVEDYKNIQKQGFNFSPRFECTFHDEYDEDGNLKDNCKLEIKENDDYIENFFGENINVTTIVGKNGSGKSSVLEFILLSVQDLKTDKSLFIFYDKGLNKLIIRHNIINKILLNNKISFDEIKFENKNYKTFFKDIKSIFPFFNYSFTYNRFINDTHIGDKMLCPNFPNKSSGKISLIQEKKDNLKTILSNYRLIKNKNKSYIFDNFFKVSNVKVYFSNYFDHLTMMDKDTNRGEALVKINNEAVDLFFKDQSTEALKIFIGFWNGIYSESPNRKNKDEYYLDMKTSIEKLSLPNSLFSKNKQQFPITLEPEKKLIDSFRRRYNFPDYKSNSSIDKNGIQHLYSSSDFNIEDVDKEYLFFEWDICQLEEFEIKKIIDCFEDPFFLIEITDNEDKSLNDLSFGELQLLTILNKILALCINNRDVDNLFLLLDEIDIGFHPDWQKRIIQYIVDFLSLLPEKNFHLIFTTHSPFLLSDIPKENIIFLNDNPSIKQTFGANIHTLLSDSFFMEDGLMGEFAKFKIDKAIKLLNQEKLDEKDLKYCEQIISIIGEPIVKNQLQRMLDSKRLKKIDIINQKIKDMSYELEILKEHQSKIVQDELRDRGKKQYRKRFEDD